MTKLEELIKELCPDGVKYEELKEILKIKNGSDYKGFSEGTIPVYGSGGILAYIDRYAYNKPSVLIPRKGSIDKLYYVDTPFWNVDTIFYTEIFPDKAIPRYVYHCLLREHLEQYNTAGGVPSLTQTVLNKVKIPVPPLPVQEEIVRILDSFTELTAELAAELAARKKQYEYYRDSLLTTDSSNAKRGVILDMLSQPITDGPHTTPSFVEHGIPFLSAEAVFDGRIHFNKKRGDITPEFDNECCKKYKPQKGDIFVVKSGSTTGKVGYVDTDIRFNIWSPLAALRVNSENSDRFLFHLLQSTQIQSQVKAKASHGSQPNLSMRALEQFEVDIPPLDVQIKIANVLDNFDSICSDLKIGLPAEIEARRKQYEYYRDLLLSFASDSSQSVNVERERERESRGRAER